MSRYAGGLRKASWSRCRRRLELAGLAERNGEQPGIGVLGSHQPDDRGHRGGRVRPAPRGVARRTLAGRFRGATGGWRGHLIAERDLDHGLKHSFVPAEAAGR